MSLFNNRNTWERAAQLAQELRAQSQQSPEPLTEAERSQKLQELSLLRIQISSLKGHHGVEAYNKLGELLEQVRALEFELS